jgi:DNA-binding transcriptional LysR family regulator
MRCLRRFAEPGVPTTLRLDVENQDGVRDRFHGGADIALFVGFDWDGDEKGYDLRPLAPLEMVLVAAREHPTTGGPLTDESRLAYAELVVRDSSPRFEGRSRPSFMGSRNVIYLPDFSSKRLAILSGAGYGWVPVHIVERELATGEIVLLDAPQNRWTYRPQLATREGARLGRGARLFIETLFEDD